MTELTVKEALNIITIETINEENIERYNQAIEIVESAKARILLIATECEDKLNEIKDDEQYIEAKQWLNTFKENFEQEVESIQNILKDLGAIAPKISDADLNEYLIYIERVNSLYSGLKKAVEAYEKAPNNIISRNFTNFGIRRYQYYKINKERVNLVRERVVELNEKSYEREYKTIIDNEYLESQNEVKKIYAEKIKNLSEKLGINFNIVKQILAMKIPEKFNGKEYLKQAEKYVKNGGDPNTLDFDLLNAVAEKEILIPKDENQITFEDLEIE